MKKKLKIFLNILIILFLVLLAYQFIFVSKEERIVKKYKKYYSEYGGKLKYVSVDEQNKHMYISFTNWGGNLQQKNEAVKETYDALKEGILGNHDYNDYTISLLFNSNNGQGYFEITGVNKEMDDLRVRNYFGVSDIEFYLETFPEVDYLDLQGVEYSNIEQLGSFEDLKYVSFGRTLTKEETLYLQSEFPECELD